MSGFSIFSFLSVINFDLSKYQILKVLFRILSVLMSRIGVYITLYISTYYNYT